MRSGDGIHASGSMRSVLALGLVMSLLLSMLPGMPMPVASAAVLPRVLLVAADIDTVVVDVQSKLGATGRFASVDIFDANAGTPTLAQLQGYDAIMVWSNLTFNSPTALGNVIAQYTDSGGGVVVAVFGNAIGSSISGRFDTANYWAIPPNGFTFGPATLGTTYVPSTHPLLQGVTSFNGGSSSFRITSTTVHPIYDCAWGCRE